MHVSTNSGDAIPYTFHLYKNEEVSNKSYNLQNLFIVFLSATSSYEYLSVFLVMSTLLDEQSWYTLHDCLPDRTPKFRTHTDWQRILSPLVVLSSDHELCNNLVPYPWGRECDPTVLYTGTVA